MRKFVPTLTLALTLALTSLSDAGTRVRQPPPLLTPEETLCHGFGELTYDLAIARDSGLPILRAISIMRVGLREHVHAPTMEQLLTSEAQHIYTNPHVAPANVREIYTLACLTNRPFAPVQTRK